MKGWRISWALMAFATLIMAQQPGINRAWRYTLLDASAITEDCPICGRPTIPYPLRGTFDLLLDNFGPLFTTYRITNLQFYAGEKGSPLYSVEGNGIYRIGGPLAVQQDMTLATKVCSSTPDCRDVVLTNSGIVQREFPLMEISVTQTQASFTSVYTLQIVAAPVREIWFVTTSGFTPTNIAVQIEAGDVLTQSGLWLRKRAWLLESNGVLNTPGLHIDALDAAPGEGMVFSTSYPDASALHEGDLYSERGYMVRSNQKLTTAFGIQPAVPDVGLDAVQVMPGGEVLFSIRTNIFAEGKGIMLRHGDVLSSLGQMVKSNQELLSRFHPPVTTNDYGLDALYVWPNGEIWFSTETGFQDQLLGDISDGDLLSTEGIIVFKNRELVAAQGAPPGDFGLGDIFVVTDASVTPAQPGFFPVLGRDNIILRWTGTNRVYQVERAPAVIGPWQPIGQIDSRTSTIDPHAVLGDAQTFYRLQAW